MQGEAVLSKYKSVEQWRRENAANIFPTKASLDWFRRCHGDELERKGAIIRRKGRAPDLVDDEVAPLIILEILKRESQTTPVTEAFPEPESRITIGPGCHTACA